MKVSGMALLVTVLVILMLVVVALSINVPSKALAASVTGGITGSGFGTSGISYGGYGVSRRGWADEYEEILAKGLDPREHCFVGYEVGRVPLMLNGTYGYGPWRRQP